ncbi:branched-chain amino acid transport system substrate-binding protein [Gammaproteobacteria bacterium]
MKRWFFPLVTLLGMVGPVLGEEVVIGLNYPETGPYAVQGLDQVRAADLAVEEINAAGGILGKQVRLAKRDSKSKPDVAKVNVAELIDKEGAVMLYGGSSSAVAIAAGEVARSKDRIYFGTLTYSNETTGANGHKYMFRECYNAWMGAKVLSNYLNEKFTGKKYFYITANYTWGLTTEASIRKFSNTEDTAVHRNTLTPFPGATESDFNKALTLAKANNPDVLVLVLFGNDMAEALKRATAMGLKKTMAIVVPNLTLGMAESAGPKIMEDVVGATPWEWVVPYQYGYEGGKKFVEKFAAKYGSYPSTSAASAYTIPFEYKAAVERAHSFDSKAVIAALEGHKYTLLKDEQEWRTFDHQSLQTVYAVKCKKQADVLKDKYKQDYFEIINVMSGSEAAQSRAEWDAERKAANAPTELAF